MVNEHKANNNNSTTLKSPQSFNSSKLQPQRILPHKLVYYKTDRNIVTMTILQCEGFHPLVPKLPLPWMLQPFECCVEKISKHQSQHYL